MISAAKKRGVFYEEEPFGGIYMPPGGSVHP